MCVLSACTSHSLQNAQGIVVKADSLWKVGQIYEDSTQLAQACEELGYWRMIYPNEYAHACYHYGRLLRQKEDPVAAMQVFINAAHSRTRDYHILGRVYNNIGDMCHRAGEYALSYNMFEQSANMYLRDGDTLSYYYCLNDMAFEQAEQSKKEETLALISIIEANCTDYYVLEKSLETKAEMYKKVAQYDSAIYYANKIHIYEPTIAIIKAFSYSELGIKDSAIWYASVVLSDTLSPYQHRFNALYILSHNDSTLNQNEVRDIASEREDIRYYEYEPQKEKLTNSILLLVRDLNYKPDLRWIYAIIGTLFVIGTFLVIHIHQKSKRYELLSQKINDLETRTNSTLAQKRKQIESNCMLLTKSPTLTQDLCWNNYDKMCDIVNQHFFLLASKLQHKQVLNETGVRLCVLVLLNLNRKDISKTLPYAQSSIGKLKDHTAKQLGTTGKNLHDYLLNLAIER